MNYFLNQVITVSEEMIEADADPESKISQSLARLSAMARHQLRNLRQFDCNRCEDTFRTMIHGKSAFCPDCCKHEETSSGICNYCGLDKNE